MTAAIHQPVLLAEVIAVFRPKPGQTYIDATADGGGHAAAIAERVSPGGTVVAIDRDRMILEASCPRIAAAGPGARIVCRYGNFADSAAIVRECGVAVADGILFDFGFSSFHIESSGRGFSFMRDEPLDMRYDPAAGETAADLVNGRSEAELAAIIREYGEDRRAERIAERIVRERKVHKIARTGALARIVASAVGRGTGRIHPATRTFQALRIAVNDELGNIARALDAVPGLLAKDGVVAAITFHSLEDRIVKNFLKKTNAAELLVPLTKKPIRPALAETKENPRARSAKLRAAKKI